MIDYYLNELRLANEKLDLDDIRVFCEMVHSACEAGQQILICGNGGSAALASHMAVDIMKSHPDARAISLVDNDAIVTAIANDIAYEYVFSEQLRALARSGDLVIGISASGQSENIMKAITKGLQLECKTVVLTGNAGKHHRTRPLHKIADHAVIVESDEYGIVEDVHTSVMHIMCESLKI